MTKKIKVRHSGGWSLRDGGRVDYYDVGNWSMELVAGELDEELMSAKESIKAYKAWYKHLKKMTKKNPRH